MGLYDGRRAVVVGGTSGIGLATARLLVDGGARVLVTGRREAALAQAREALGPGAAVAASDAASPAAADALAERVRSDLGTIDALFVCAGENSFVPFADVTEASFDAVLAANARGPYFTVQRLSPLIAEGGGVVFVTSIANVLGIPMISTYAASKAALRSMTRSLARELLPRGVRVNAVSPGPIDTGILERSLPPEAAGATRRQMTEGSPMQRFGRPEEVARALVFLAFDATYTTGAELPVDGGGSQV